MLNKFKSLSLFIFLTCFVFITLADDEYKYRDYDKIMKDIEELNNKYPNYIKVYNAREENLILPDLMKCGEKECDFMYYLLSDFTQNEENIKKLPQIFLLGGIHGDEIIGSNTLIYLTKHLLENHHKNKTLNFYLKQRLIIIYPISNPSGFYQLQREEIHEDGIRFDPNRDFAYNVKDNECMLTATGIVINHIYNKFLIQAAISFHGGDNSITYPWGGNNHIISRYPYVGNKSPDNFAFADIANILRNEAGSNGNLAVEEYNIGTMTDIVYPVNGGLEDWAYGGGWENKYNDKDKVIPNCKQFNNSNNTLNTSNNFVKSLLFLVECGESKIPDENTLGKKSGLKVKSESNWGHVTRNIVLSLTYIDLIKPYINIIDLQSKNNSLEIKYKAKGCFQVTKTYILYRNHTVNFNYHDKNTINESEWLKSESFSGPGFWLQKDFNFVFNLTIENAHSVDLIVVLNCDEKWGEKTDNAVPSVDPQSHLVLSRTKEDYSETNNGFKIESNKYIMKKINNVVINGDYLKSKNNLRMLSKFIPCNESAFRKKFQENNFIYFNLNTEKHLNIFGKIDYLKNNVDFLLYENGDISNCNSYLGRILKINEDESFYSEKIKYEDKNFIKNISFLYGKKEIDLIGRSIVLKNEENQLIAGQILIDQNYECKKFAKKCFGLPLINSEGICLIQNDLIKTNEENYLIKIYITPNYITNSSFISIKTNKKLLIEKYDLIEKIKITNSEKNYLISFDERNKNNFIAKDLKFDLDPNETLGNKLLISIINVNEEEIKIGLCDIGRINNIYLDNDRNIIQETTTSDNYKHITLIFTIIGLFIFFLFVGKKIIQFIKFSQNDREKIHLVGNEGKENQSIDKNITPKFFDIENNENENQSEKINEDSDN